MSYMCDKHSIVTVYVSIAHDSVSVYVTEIKNRWDAWMFLLNSLFQWWQYWKLRKDKRTKSPYLEIFQCKSFSENK